MNHWHWQLTSTESGENWMRGDTEGQDVQHWSLLRVVSVIDSDTNHDNHSSMDLEFNLEGTEWSFFLLWFIFYSLPLWHWSYIS